MLIYLKAKFNLISIKVLTFKLNFEICEKQYSAEGHEIERKKKDVFVKSKANT